ncbi:MAG: 30S ribosomal protein S6--L-glutamate ligase [Deltaproteobacteria bacterium]|nr:30S ribosomal protein S6--L-glutamate ligase [Deltaproteobacteria bacterium]
MKLGILSGSTKIYSTRRLMEAARDQKHNVKVIRPAHCAMLITKNKPQLFYRGKRLETFDAILPRIGVKQTLFGLAVVRQFEMMGTYCVNSSYAIARSRDKLRSLQILCRRNVGLPPTAFIKKPEYIEQVIEKLGGSPVIIKLLQGTQGKGVILADTKTAAASVIEAFHGIDEQILIQQFVAQSEGSDIRAIVVGGKVIASMKRQAVKGEFRANLHRGGTAENIRLDKQYKNTAIRAAKILGLHVAGVDMLMTDEGPVVLEVNSSPGLEGIENTTDVDVAGAIIHYIHRQVTRPTKSRVIA